MPTIYVRLTGNDSTGTGAYDNPYLTIFKGTSVAVAGDTVDVGAGLYLEVTPAVVTVPLFLRGMLGQTRWQLANLVGVDPSLMTFTSGLSGVAGNVVVAGFMLEPLVAGFRTVVLVQGIPAGGVWWVRNIFRHKSNEFAVYRQDTDDQFAVLLNNSLVSQVPGQIAGRGVADLNSPPFRAPTIAINNIFKDQKSVVDDTLGQRGIISAWNCFSNCDREFRFGVPGNGDIHSDPQFLNEALLNYQLSPGSPCLAMGFDVDNLGVQTTDDLELNPGLPFGDGTVRDSVPPPIQTNMGSFGPSLDIGAIETTQSDTNRQVNNFVIHTILAAFASELSVINSQQEYIKLGRVLDGADVNQLQSRWGELLATNRPSNFTRNDFEAYIQTLITAFQNAPAITSIKQTISALLSAPVVRLDYIQSPRWRLGVDLKIIVPDPGGHPTQAAVTKGRFQLLNQWWQIDQQTLTIAPGVNLLAACPFDISLLLGNGKPELLQFPAASDEVIPPAYNFFFSVNVRVTNGSTTLKRASASPLFNILQPGFVFRIVSYDYHVLTILDQNNLELSEPWMGDDQIIAAQIGLPMMSFGYVTVVDGAITRVKTHSRLGSTSYADSRLGRAHSFELQVEAFDNATFLSSNRAESQLYGLLTKMVPVHKRGLLSFQDEGGKARPSNPFAVIDYDFVTSFTESFVDSTWNVTI